jgi:hypothetical protein
MDRKMFLLLVVVVGTLIYSCNNTGEQRENKRNLFQNKIRQKDDGTISLMVDKADCYHDMINPESNTAEWNVVVSKSGRYNVWLSSATIDTTDLKYKNSVRLNILDNRFESLPVCNKVIHNSSDVTYPYYRADSFMGSLYLKDTGLYNIQIISDKIVPKDYRKDGSDISDESKLLSVFLTPIVR